MNDSTFTQTVEEALERFTNKLPIKATEIGWELIGEQQQALLQAITEAHKKELEEAQEQLLDELETNKRAFLNGLEVSEAVLVSVIEAKRKEIKGVNV